MTGAPGAAGATAAYDLAALRHDPLDHLPARTDVIVVGLGVTGAGVALDAATRGLDVVALEAHDLAFGTSRWSSKLVHGGLRYLARGQVGVAHESAVERGILMETTAPHLTRPLGMLLPLMSSVPAWQGGLARAGFAAGDLLRLGAGTSPETLPHPHRISAPEVLALAPGLRTRGLRGGLLAWDGQLEDDARLVTCLVRTAVAYGAIARTRTRVVAASRPRPGADLEVRVRDELTGETRTIAARAVVNATGVWAGELGGVTLRPSRGTHLVLRSETLGGLHTGITAPVPGSTNRYALVLPHPDGTVHVGLTDEPTDQVVDVPQPTEAEIGFLLDVVSAAFERPLHRCDVVGAFAGLRPLLQDASADAEGSAEDTPSADISRRHAVIRAESGVLTIVGGKLTTYRRMAQDAMDATGLTAAPCRTRSLPLVGAASREVLAAVDAPARLVRRFGVEAPLVIESARATSGMSTDELTEPVAAGLDLTRAELIFGVTHEGALTSDDLLDRRTRVGLVPADRALAEDAAAWAMQFAAAQSV